LTTYALFRLDAPDVAALRASHRDSHVAHLRSAEMPLKLGGLLLDEEDKVVGSLVVFEADSLGQVEDWVAKDPLTKAGVFDQVSIRRWKIVNGEIA
jgi:uncharacterized protein YciI